MKVEYLDSMGDDRRVVNAARVSFAKQKEEFDQSDERLIRYLARNGHESPFFHPQVQLRITAPIFIARQWWRHQIGVARNEVSRRYVDTGVAFHRITRWRKRPADSIKQGSGEDLDPHQQFSVKRKVDEVQHQCRTLYENLIERGVAPEQARSVLPQSMYTQWIETGSLAYYARACQLRLAKDAQGEIQELAALVAQVVGPLFPVSWSALCSTK
mgnify:CR=1 FL=1